MQRVSLDTINYISVNENVQRHKAFHIDRNRDQPKAKPEWDFQIRCQKAHGF